MHAAGWDYMVDIQKHDMEAIKEFNEKYKEHPYMNVGNAPKHGVNR